MRLKITAVICAGCGEPAAKIAFRKERQDLLMGYFRLCRCWKCLIDFLILFDDDGKLITVMSEPSAEDFLVSAGSVKPEWWGDIPF